MNFPSGEHSGMVTGPLALRWYVVLADISPFAVTPANIDSYKTTLGHTKSVHRTL